MSTFFLNNESETGSFSGYYCDVIRGNRKFGVVLKVENISFTQRREERKGFNFNLLHLANFIPIICRDEIFTFWTPPNYKHSERLLYQDSLCGQAAAFRVHADVIHAIILRVAICRIR